MLKYHKKRFTRFIVWFDINISAIILSYTIKLQIPCVGKSNASEGLTEKGFREILVCVHSRHSILLAEDYGVSTDSSKTNERIIRPVAKHL